MTARDGMEGVSKLFTYHPDLIILDVMMPGMDGYEVCRRIRNDPLIETLGDGVVDVRFAVFFFAAMQTLR